MRSGKTVLVDFAPAEAFEPPHDQGVVVVADEDALVRRREGEGGRLRAACMRVGVRGDGRGTAPWARITAWEPPDRFVMDWLIGNCAGTEVEVRFSPEGPGARVGFRAPRLIE